MASIRKRGKYFEYRVVYHDSLGERHEASCGGFKTKAQARAAGQKREVELRNSPMSNNEVTMLDYYKAWAQLYKKPYIKKKLGTLTNKQKITSLSILGKSNLKI